MLEMQHNNYAYNCPVPAFTAYHHSMHHICICMLDRRELGLFLRIREHHLKLQLTPVYIACGAHMDVQLHRNTWRDCGGMPVDGSLLHAYTEQG